MTNQEKSAICKAAKLHLNQKSKEKTNNALSLCEALYQNCPQKIKNLYVDDVYYDSFIYDEFREMLNFRPDEMFNELHWFAKDDLNSRLEVLNNMMELYK